MKKENTIIFAGIIALLCIASLIAAFTGMDMVSSATETAYEKVYAADMVLSTSIAREGGYEISEMNTFLSCFAHQRLVTGGILASIGGLGLIFCIHWFLVLLKLLLKGK